MTWLAVPLAIATAISTMFGGLVAFRLRKELATVIAFTGGIVVAVALFDVLPEALDLIDSPRHVMTVVGAGFVGFFLVERVLVLHHRDEPEQARAHARVGALGAAGLSLHSFLDGLGIGLALHVNTATGLLVFLAVISHDFADGMNTVSFVLRQSGDGRSAARWLAIDATAPLIGASRRCVARDLRSRARLCAGRVRRVLPVPRRDRPAARGAQPPVVAARAAHDRRLCRDVRRRVRRFSLGPRAERHVHGLRRAAASDRQRQTRHPARDRR